jgi:hypothetical protein
MDVLSTQSSNDLSEVVPRICQSQVCELGIREEALRFRNHRFLKLIQGKVVPAIMFFLHDIYQGLRHTVSGSLFKYFFK